MSQAESKGQAARASETVEVPSLDRVLDGTKKPQVRDTLKDAAEALWRDVAAGKLEIPRSRAKLIDEKIKAIDQLLGQQVSSILHHPDVQRLEGSWRGLHQLVKESETGTQLQIQLLNIKKEDLANDLIDASDFDQSQLWRKIYESEYGMAGGKPFSAMVVDFQFSHHPEDVQVLEQLASIGGSSLCPFITAPSPELFGLESFEGLAHVRDTAKIFATRDYARWNSFRSSADSCWVTMAMPRMLGRLPYGKATKRVEKFDFEEFPLGKDGTPGKVDHDQFCWSSAAYALGQVLTRAFAETGWCTAIRGRENGGMIERLPCYTFSSDDGDVDLKCPTEIGITDRKENELSSLGFLPLCHYKDTDFAVFFGAQTLQKPKEFVDAADTANARIAARLPYLMAVSRIGHYLKCAGRDWTGSFMDATDLQEKLSRWVAQFVLDDAKADAEMKAKYPLREASIEVEAVPGKPGSYRCVARLRPWIQMEELTASLRLVAEIRTKQS